MGLVYASAESVFSWLAAEDKDLPLAFYILHFLWPMIEEKGRDALQVVEDLEWLRQFPGLCYRDPETDGTSTNRQ